MSVALVLLLFLAFLWSVGLGELLGLGPRATPPAVAAPAPSASASDPPATAPLNLQPTDLIREVCLNALRSKLGSAFSAEYNLDDMPRFQAEHWAWKSAVTIFIDGAEQPRPFSCTVTGSTLQTATTTLLP